MRRFGLDSSMPPFLARDGLPESERDAAWQVSCYLTDLQSKYLRALEAALALKTFAASNYAHANKRINEPAVIQNQPEHSRLVYEIQLFGEWMMIAGRDAAMTIYHFAEAIDAIKTLTHQCPSLEKMIDWKRVRAAQKVFSTGFPQYENIRDAIAHDAQLSRSAKAVKRNSFSGSFKRESVNLANVSNFRFTGSIGDEHVVTINRQILTFSLNGETVEKLRKALLAFYECFYRAEVETAANALAAQAEAARAKSASQSPPD